MKFGTGLVLAVALSAALATVANAQSAAPAAAPAQDKTVGPDGKWTFKDGTPTYDVQADGTMDWFTYSGFRRYHSECHVCHGPEAQGSTYAPSLATSLKTIDYGKFLQIVASGQVGVDKNNIMPALGDNKNVMCYVDDIYTYIRAKMKRPASVADQLRTLTASRALLGLAVAGGVLVASLQVGTWPVHSAESGAVDIVNRKVLRVCSDPANMPFSNEKEEGFENKIANVIADELKVPVEYTWFPMATGFVRMTLFSKRCDLIVGYAQGDELVLNSNAYYRSTYALVYRAGKGLDGVEDLSDPRLKDKRVGLIANTPPGTLMVKEGLMAKAKPYPLVVDRRFESPTEVMIKDIRSGDVDAGVLWGPIAGYYSSKDGEQLVVKPLAKEAANDPNKMAFRVTLGVRPTDTDWKKQLNTVLTKRRADIEKVLLGYGVPLLDEESKPISAPRP
jgi:methanol metabolism-related c-type cytochrome